MPQSLAQVLVHLIFGTKGRQPVIAKGFRPDLDAYLAGTFQNLDSPAIAVKSVADHVHVLFRLSRTHAIAQIVEEAKKGSSKWLKTKAPALRNFHWQNGYAAFSVSQSRVKAGREYIENQERHHERMSFQEEYRAFLGKHGVEFDERYVWD